MSKLIARAALGVLILLVILYIAMLVAANTSITQRTIQTEVTINATASKVWQVLTDFEAYPQWNPFIRQIDGAIQPGQQLIIELNLSGRTMTFNPTVLVMHPKGSCAGSAAFPSPGYSTVSIASTSSLLVRTGCVSFRARRSEGFWCRFRELYSTILNKAFRR
jgi:hypothetical protein